jgi:hypothetical protein
MASKIKVIDGEAANSRKLKEESTSASIGIAKPVGKKLTNLCIEPKHSAATVQPNSQIRAPDSSACI